MADVVRLPETGYLRIPQILGNPKADPPIPPLIPISSSTWWKGIKDGIYPKGIKLSARVTAWRVEDIKRLIENPGTIAIGRESRT